MDNEAMMNAYNAVLTVRDLSVRRFARIREERERFLGNSGLSNEFVSGSEKPMAGAVEVEAEHKDGAAASIASDYPAPEVSEGRTIDDTIGPEVDQSKYGKALLVAAAVCGVLGVAVYLRRRY